MIYKDMLYFASDNYSPICPEAMEEMIQCNEGYQRAYGEDIYTAIAADAIRDFFEHDCDVYFVTTGTAANALALSSVVKPYQSVICHQEAHIETDECGAPEFFSNGIKLQLAEGFHGKLDAAAVERLALKRDDIHYPQPAALSLTQSTETGTLYQPEEMKELGERAHELNLKVHLDGARFFNAVAALGIHPGDISWRTGVDVMSLGGSKNGMPPVDAVVFFDPSLSETFAYRCKQAGQLVSKMRYMAAPWHRMLADEIMVRNAAHANAMAVQLAEGFLEIDGITIAHPVEANAVFAVLGEEIEQRLRDRGWIFYNFIAGGPCRFMCSWSTTPEMIEELLSDCRK